MKNTPPPPTGKKGPKVPPPRPPTNISRPMQAKIV